MTTVDFYKNNGLNAEVNLQQSKNHYAESDDPIIWVGLNRAIDGQDYLVLSHTAATKLLAGDVEFEELAVTSQEGRWGITMPPSSVTIKTFTLKLG